MQSNTTNLLLLVLFLISLSFAQQQEDNSTNTTTSIVTGPIIGRVNTTTARILIEFDTDGPITLILTDPSGNTTNTTRNATANIPVPFAFENLQPGTRYNVSLEDSSIEMTESYFTTLTGESGKLNFAVLSCMDRKQQLAKQPEADLWADMLRRVQNNEISYLLQTGDQVYMDHSLGAEDPEKPYTKCMEILNATAPEQWDDKKQELLELLRSEYRQTWGIESVRDTLSKIPSLTIFDDHQIRDDWGFLEKDRDPTTADYYYGTLARQVYYEYERQLREDIDFNNLDQYTTEYFYEVLNDIGFFFIDYRAVRTWDRNYSQIDDSQIGVNQTDLLKQVLEPTNGTFANISNFFLVSPLTFVFLVEQMMQIGYFTNNDAQESWTYRYKDQQAEVLDLLRNWKIAKEGREVTILDGDIHMGGFTDIMYDDDFAFLQFTTSSIASSAPSDASFLAFEALKEVENLVDPWDYEHHDWTNKFNYGIVIANNVDGAATADCFLVQASDDEAPEIVSEDGDSLDESDWNEVLGRGQ